MPKLTLFQLITDNLFVQPIFYRTKGDIYLGIDQRMLLFGKEKLVEDCDAEDRPIWANDQMRHTAITHRLKIIKHICDVAEWSGNSPKIIKSNYQSVKGITAQSTKEFYDLTLADTSPLLLKKRIQA